jgi:hypothetical protein
LPTRRIVSGGTNKQGTETELSQDTRLMALFTAYLDASGDWKNQPFVVVSGYIANLWQWKSLEGVWRGIHEEFNVQRPFHMAEFVAALYTDTYKNQKNARADYVEIAKDRMRAEAFLKKLVIAQVTMTNCAVTCVVRMNIYKEIDSLVELREKIPPLALGARYCLERIHKWEEEFEIEEPVELIFEEGDFGQGHFSDLIVSEGMPPPIYKKKDDFAGLQMSDHYAWEITYRLKSEEKEKQLNVEFEPRGELLTLYWSIPRLHIEPTQESLINICHVKGINARAWKKG